MEGQYWKGRQINLEWSKRSNKYNSKRDKFSKNFGVKKFEGKKKFAEERYRKVRRDYPKYDKKDHFSYEFSDSESDVDENLKILRKRDRSLSEEKNKIKKDKDVFEIKTEILKEEKDNK